MNALTTRVLAQVDPELTDFILELGIEFRDRGDYRVPHAWIYVLDLVWPSHKARFSMAQGRTIYLAASHAIAPAQRQGVIRHEVQHVMQWSAWYALSYVLSRKCRVRWEVEAYAQNMLEVYESTGVLSPLVVVRTGDLLANNYVLLTHKMKANAREQIAQVAERIRQGEVSGYDTTTIFNED